jgi:hypothetical protein
MLSTPEGFEVLGVDESDLFRLCSSAQPLLAELAGHWEPISSPLTVI